MKSGERDKKRGFRKFAYRGVDFEELVEMPIQEFAKLLPAHGRRRLRRGLQRREISLLLKCERAKRENTDREEKPACVTTHARNMFILPQMVGNIVGVYNGREYVQYEIKPEMIGFRLGDFSLTHRYVQHGKPGFGATASSKFVPLK